MRRLIIVRPPRLPRQRRQPLRTRRARTRRGMALFVILIFVVAAGAMATTAIVTTGNATLVAKSHARENDLRYAAEAGLAIGKSRINFDPSALPDSGAVALLENAELNAADGNPIPGVVVNVYVGPTGSTSGQFGRFASIVAEARDPQGNGFVRRLEVTQESFAKYAYWSDDESNGSGTIYFGGGDQLWGPVWSNDKISIAASGATFHDNVATASTIAGAENGLFKKGYKENQIPIQLPSTAELSAKLQAFASPANLAFTAPTTGSASGIRARLEFIALDLNNDGDSLDADEGFVRFYVGASGASDWVRGDWLGGTSVAPIDVETCGDYHAVPGSSQPKFFPAAVHPTTWFRDLMVSAGMTTTQANSERDASVRTIMNRTGSRCFLGGSPQLAAVARTTTLGYATTAIRKGGDDTTFTPTDKYGAWVAYGEAPGATLLAKRPHDAQYLFPLHRSLNPLSKGVIHVTGSVGVSGVVRSRLTVYSTGTLVVLDDTRYANDPGAGVCADMLGLIASNNIVVADNALLTPQRIKTSSPTITKNVDDTKDLYLHAVVMALNTSFTVENYDSGPDNVNDCEGSDNGRGCLYLTGGLIQQSRGPVGLLGGEGFVKRYSYDRCAVINPPPYFPTTGRFEDNRYYELDPVGLDIDRLYESLTPSP